MTAIVYKEFLPDQPELGNQGLLRALNVLPRDDGYAPYQGLALTGQTIGSAAFVQDAFLSSGITKGAERVYSYAGGQFYSGNITIGGASTLSPSNVGFAQYENFVIAVSDAFQAVFHTAGATSTVGTLASNGTAPPAQAIGVIGQFVVIGGLGTKNSGAQSLNAIQWSGVDAPRSWPSPGSATAIAQQAGQQDLPSIFGEVQAIHGGDQHGVVFQKRGVTRMTYVGPPAVFQFDTVSSNEGCFFVRGHLRVKNLSYFVSEQGFCRTDGVSIEHIGAGKVDREFWNSIAGSSSEVQVGYDPKNDLVYFAYSTNGNQSLDKILVFNPKSGNWGQASQAMTAMVGGAISDDFSKPMRGIGTAGGQSVIGFFNATAGAAVMETGDFEFNEGGRAYVDAIKPHVESAGTAPAATVAIGYRNDLGSTPTYTSEATQNSRTGFANTRVDAKYMRFRTTITGNFKKTTGIEVNPIPSGAA